MMTEYQGGLTQPCRDHALRDGAETRHRALISRWRMR